MDLYEYFYITVSNDQMKAEIHCTDHFDNMEEQIDEIALIRFIHDHKITFGIQKEAITSVVFTKERAHFPITIAMGTLPQNGQDGSISYTFNLDTSVEKTDDWNFRDIMRIPTVSKGQKLATIRLPTAGKNGMNIYGKVLLAKKGRPAQLFAGKNVEFRESELAYYSTIKGQVSVVNRFIEVHDIYEVDGDLSMKTGNLDFVGSIIIHGDVPTGYKVKAGGDVKIFGIVEAAEVVADGSIFISEGLAGMQKGKIKASRDIHIGYINQGIAIAENNIFVENSILHSEIKANQSVICQRGNIIGGTIKVGNSVKAKDIGNRLSTETSILFIKDELLAEQAKLLEKKEILEETLSKLQMIKKQLQNKTQDAKIRITLLRQKNSEQKIIKQIVKIDHQLLELKTKINNEKEQQLVVKEHLYMNVKIAFDKYKYKVEKVHHQVKVLLEHKEVIIKPYMLQ